jgi:hypothetical protein
MNENPDEPPWHTEPEIRIEDEGDGKYGLYVDGARVIWIGPTYANPLHRDFHFAIYGPCNLDRGIAIMKGFFHLTALLGNEQRASASQPATSENDGKSSKEQRKWQTSKTTRRSKTS